LFFGLGTGSSLALAFKNAGFLSIEERRVTSTLKYANDQDALCAMIDGGAVALAAKRFDSATRSKVESELLKAFLPYKQPDGRYAIPGEFVVVKGRKPPAAGPA
jgi:hypothetical protein